MIKAGEVWLIDHGAALTFQYDWQHVTEQTPRRPGTFVGDHLLSVTPRELAASDRELGPKLSRTVLQHALDCVPDELLSPLVPALGDLSRQRSAYVAFLWKRLQAPRPFVRP